MKTQNNLLSQNGECYYLSRFLETDIASFYFQKLHEEIKWEAREIMIFGRKVMQPRLTAWYGEPEAVYKYSGTIFKPRMWTKTLLELKKKVEKQTQTDFNAVLLNHYRDGEDYMGFHSDNEKELGNHPTIASLSLGAERTFKVQHKFNKELKLSFPLEDASLVIMAGEMQEYWKHSISKSKRVNKDRINLTFRKIQR